MTALRTIGLASTIAATMAISACGGGGGGGPSSMPAPTPSPTPTPTPTQAPAGAWYDTSSSRTFTTLSQKAVYSQPTGTTDVRIDAAPASDADSQVQIRYSLADGAYVVTLPGYDEGRIIGSSITSGASSTLQTPTILLGGKTFTYTNLAAWQSRETRDGRDNLTVGYFAFGTPTAAGDVPTTGSATYTGVISAVTDSAFTRTSEGFITPVQVGGDVVMNFDFAAATLAGHIAPVLVCGNCFESYLAPINFSQTVFSPGSTSFSGKFDTSLSGANWFSGIFTGPGAAEAMAKFQVPIFDGEIYQISGVWVAKKN